MLSRLLHALWAFSLLLLTACGSDSSNTTPAINIPPVAAAPDYWPTTAWKMARPEDHKFTNGALTNLANDAAAALPYYTSLLVIKDGYIVHESFHDTPSETGNTADTKHHVWSISKSVTSMTMGRAMTLGDMNIPANIMGKNSVLDLTVADVFPAAAISSLANADERRNISLRDTLQMRSGLAWNESAWLLTGKDPLLTAFSNPACDSADPAVILCSILQRPLAYAPGSTWNYDTYSTYLVSGFFTGITGTSLNSYAGAHLFTPLGITLDSPSDWPNLPEPYTFGGGLLNIRSRDLAKLGLLMLYNGKWGSEQLISPEWMATSLTKQGNGKLAAFDISGEPKAEADDGDINYGMQWWRSTTTDMVGIESITAIGLYGQQMSIFRDRGLIILITCDSDGTTPRDRYTEINTFLKEKILDKLVL